jgi:hypothetical protein
MIATKANRPTTTNKGNSMLELISEAVSSLQLESATYPHNVQVWMKLMAASFLASLFFIYKHKAARWILLVLMVNIAGLIFGKIVFPEASRSELGTWVHLLFWPALLWAAWRSKRQQPNLHRAKRFFDFLYSGWFYWACLLILTSLILDARNLFLMLT